MSKKWRSYAVGLLGSAMLTTGCVTTSTVDQLIETNGAEFETLPALLAHSTLKPVDPMQTLPVSAATMPTNDYVIGPSDEIIVSVWGFPALGSQIPVSGDSRRNISIVKQNGQIQLPFLGNVQVGGLTTQEAAAQLTTAYTPVTKRDDTQVDVTVARFLSRAARVNGEVENPGNVFLSDQVQTLKDAIDSAGGPTRDAASSQATVKRGDNVYRLNYYAGINGESGTALNYPLQKGDVIYFPHISENTVHVLGEVRDQGIIAIPQEGISILEALSRQGGLDLTFADADSILLIRKDENTVADRPTIYKMSYAELLLNESVALQKGDRLFVPPTDLARWQRSWQQALPFIVGGAQGTLIYRNLNERAF